jgi:hypothetical protein
MSAAAPSGAARSGASVATASVVGGSRTPRRSGRVSSGHCTPSTIRRARARGSRPPSKIGAIVACPGQAPRRIIVADDLARGLLTVDTDAIRETFRYDPDTGRLLSPSDVAPPGPSVFTGDG